MPRTYCSPARMVEADSKYILYLAGSLIKAKNCITGAVPFTGTDAGAVLNSVISAMSGVGGHIHIKEGTYGIGTTVNLINELRITGENASATKLRLNNDVDADMFAYTGGTNIYWFTLEHMTLDGNKTNNTAGSGVATNDNAFDGLIHDVYIDSFEDEGVDLGDTWGWRITNSVIEHGNDDGLQISSGNNFTLIGSKIGSNAVNGIDCLASSGWGNIIGNYIFDNNQHGIKLATSYKWEIVGNTIYGNNQDTGTYCGIYLSFCKYCIINSNVFHGNDVEDYCLWLRGGNDNIITDNYFDGGVSGNVKYSNNVYDTLIRDNKGWTTENCGNVSGLLCSGFIAHGLNYCSGYGPNCVQLTPMGGSCGVNDLRASIAGVPSGSGFYVSLVTCSGCVPASGNVYWSAKNISLKSGLPF